MRGISRLFAIAIVGAALCVSGWTSAQALPSWELGLKAGVGVAKLTGDDTKNISFFDDPTATVEGDMSDMKIGFVGGGYCAVNLTDRFGARLEALYSQKGGKGNFTGDFGGTPFTGEAKLKLDYIEIPLLAVVTFPAGPSGTFDVFAGPAVAFTVSAKADVSATAGGETQEETVDIKDDLKTTDFGGTVGAGFTLALAKVNLFADARWTYGFTKIDDSSDGMDIKNNAFGFMVGVALPLAKTQ